MQAASLIEALGVENARVIAIVGGGGKSSLMSALGKEYNRKGDRVVLTTTTHIYRPERNAYFGDDPAVFSSLLEQYGLITAGMPIEDGRLATSPLLEQFPKLADRVIIEADGSKGRPIKVPRQGEPVIPDFVDVVLAVGGLSALGKPLEEVCQRPELAKTVFGFTQETVSPALMAELLTSPRGQRKEVGGRRYAVLLNQADAVSRVEALETARELLNREAGRVVIAALKASPQDITVLTY